MKMKLISGLGMSNETLLNLLPFGTGYLLNEDGEPEGKSVSFAMALQTIDMVLNPHTIPTTYTN
jgi:hypothetical protein